jgi:hypothetical protein
VKDIACNYQSAARKSHLHTECVGRPGCGEHVEEMTGHEAVGCGAARRQLASVGAFGIFVNVLTSRRAEQAAYVNLTTNLHSVSSCYECLLPRKGFVKGKFASRMAISRRRNVVRNLGGYVIERPKLAQI